MKKYLIALLLGIGFMSMQVSAATLHLDSSDSTQHLTGSTVTGNATNISLWNFDVVGGPANINFTIPSGILGFSLGGPSVFAPLANGSFNTGLYTLLFVGPGTSGTYSISAAIQDTIPNPDTQVPVPAAVWLFGSALMGLFGVGRRKSQSALAA